MNSKEFVSIEEMIGVTNNQLLLLEELRSCSKLNNEELFQNRVSIFNKLDQLYGYKNIKEGYAIHSTKFDAATPLRRKLSDVIIEVLIDEFLKLDQLGYEFHSCNKGYIRIYCRKRGESTQERLSLYQKEILGRISPYTNEFVIYNFKEIEHDKELEELKEKELEKSKKILELYISARDKTKSISELMELEKEIWGTKYTILKRIKLTSFIKLELSRGKYAKELAKTIKDQEYIVNNKIKELLERKERRDKANELYGIINSYENKMREIFTNYGFVENKDEYFAFN